MLPARGFPLFSLAQRYQRPTTTKGSVAPPDVNGERMDAMTSAKAHRVKSKRPPAGRVVSRGTSGADWPVDSANEVKVNVRLRSRSCIEENNGCGSTSAGTVITAGASGGIARRPSSRQWPLTGKFHYDIDRPELAGQRRSSPNASGLIVDGRRSTLSRQSAFSEAAVRRIRFNHRTRQAAESDRQSGSFNY